MSTYPGYAGPVGPEILEAVRAALPATVEPTHGQVIAIARAYLGLYEALEELALVDGAGGSESIRVCPVALSTLLAHANPLREDLAESASALAGGT